MAENRIEIIVTTDASGAVTGLQQVQGAADKTGKKLDEVTKGPAKAMGDVFRNFAEQGQAVAGSWTPVVASLGSVGLAIGAAAAIATSSVRQFVQFADQVRDLSFISGGSATEVSELVSGLEDLGVEADSVQVAMNRMSAAIVNGDPVLNKLGVSVRDEMGQRKNALTLYYETIDALGKVTDANERNRLSQELYGRGWRGMMDAIQMGSVELRKMGQENATLGKTMNESGVKAAREYQLAVKDLGNAWEGFSIQAGSIIVPAFTKILKAMTPVKAEAEDQIKLLGEYAAVIDYLNVKTAAPQHVPTMLPDTRAAVAQERKVGTPPPSPENEAERKARLAYESQIAVLRAEAAVASARTNQEETAAQVRLLQAQKQAALNTLETKKSEYADVSRYEQLRADTAAAFDQRIAGTRAKSNEAMLARQADAERKYYDNTDILDGKELVARERRALDLGRFITQVNEQTNLQRFNQENEFQERVRQLRMDYTGFDDTANQQYVEDFNVTEAQITAVRLGNLDKVIARHRMVNEEMQRYLDYQRQSADAAMQQYMARASQIAPGVTAGMSEMYGGIGKMQDLATDKDPYSMDLERAMQHQADLVELEKKGFDKKEEIAAASQNIMTMVDRKGMNERLAYAGAGFQMLSGMLASFNNTAVGHSKTYFRMMKVLRAGEAIINTASAVMNAMNATPVYWVNLALAIATAAMGAAQVATIMSQSETGGGQTVVTPTGAGGYVATPVEEPAKEQMGPRPMAVNITVYGSIVDHDAFARELQSSLRKAQEDRV